MWICFNNAFVSVVQDRDKPGYLLVRARRKAHLTKLFPKAKITETPKRDYRWRVSVPPLYMADLVAKHIIGIDYGNFKDSVKEDALHDMYSLWWGDHHRYQTDRHRQKWG
jgi:hypothetical protein